MKRDDPAVAAALPATQRACDRWAIDDASAGSNVDMVIEEVPVALVYNGISHAVMLASPADLEDFALGFSLTEGIIGARSDVHDLEVVAVSDGIEVQLTIASGAMVALKERRRALAGRTGCGLCGVETLREAMRAVRPLDAGTARIAERLSSAALARAFDALRSRQPLHRATGAAHAAAFADWSGELVCVREDVGRHNALDKLIGALAGPSLTPLGFVLVTSRASHEMVHKTAAAGIALLAALAAPTALAIRTAHEAGLTLIAGAGRGAARIYSRPDRSLDA